MLDRYESTITVADSCQSLSPGPTPKKKRPYTQVFSTPVALRTMRTSAKTTPTSPLKHVHLPPLHHNDMRKRPCLDLTQDHKYAQVRERRKLVLVEQPNRISWESLDRLLRDAEWLAEQMSSLLSEAKRVMDTEAYTGFIRLGHEDYERLLQAGDFDDEGMSEVAGRYIIDRHIVRTRRHLKRMEVEDRMQVLFQSEVNLSRLADGIDDCVPPTPPDSHPGHSEQEELLDNSRRSEDDHDHDNREENESNHSDCVDDDEDNLSSTEFTQYQEPSSPCQAFNNLDEPDLPPWPASGAKEFMPISASNHVRQLPDSTSAGKLVLGSSGKSHHTRRRSTRLTKDRL